MYLLNQQGLGESLERTVFTELDLESFYDWEIRIYHSSGGLKKSWFFGQDNNPINKIKFELNEHLLGAGTITFAFLDFPIDSDDFVELWYQNGLKYKALVDVDADPKGGKIKLVPYHIRFGEKLINNNFSGKTIKEMLQTIIEDNQSVTEISWNDSFIDIDDTDTFSFDYSSYKSMKAAIDELVKKLDDRRWGVDTSNIFNVYTQNSSVDEIMLNTDEPYYKEIKVKNNYNKIKATRYTVLKKLTGSGKSGTEEIGQVGYDSGSFTPGSNWPTPSIEEVVRRKEKKFNVSQVITDDGDAKDYAYENLLFDTRVPRNIKLKDFDISKKFPVIGEKWTVEDQLIRKLRTLINCDQLLNDDTTVLGQGSWLGVTLDTDDFITGSASVEFSSGIASYTFGTPITFYGATKICFMIKGTVSGEYLQLVVQDDRSGWSVGKWSSGKWSDGISASTSTTKTIKIDTSSVWEYVEFELDSPTIGVFRVEFTDTTTSTVNIDRVQLWQVTKDQYTENVVQADIEISKKGDKSTVAMQEIDLTANDVLFSADRQIEKLEEASQEV